MIVSVLLSCAFFFSQQSNSKTCLPSATETLAVEGESLADVPDCAAETSDEDKLQCFTDAEAISQRLMEEKVASILAQESDPERRIEFMETQYAWEASREADCNYLHKVSIESDGRSFNYAVCIYNQNLARLDILDKLFCNWFDPSGCAGEVLVDE